MTFNTIKSLTAILLLNFYIIYGQDSSSFFNKKKKFIGLSTSFDFDNRNLNNDKSKGNLNSNDFKIAIDLGYFIKNNYAIFLNLGFSHYSYNNESNHIKNGKSRWSYTYNGMFTQFGSRKYINVSKNKLFFTLENRNSIAFGKTIYDYHLSGIDNKFANRFQAEISARMGFSYNPMKNLLISATMNLININFTKEFGNYNDSSKNDFFKINTPLFPDLDISIHYLLNSK